MKSTKSEKDRVLFLLSILILFALLAVSFFLIREILRPSPYSGSEGKGEMTSGMESGGNPGYGPSSGDHEEEIRDPGQDLVIMEDSKSDIPRSFLTLRPKIVEDEEKAMAVPYLMQKDGRWSQRGMGESTVGEAGCGPTCMAMVAMSLTRNYALTPDLVADELLAGNYYVEDIGTKWTYMSEAPAMYGFHGKEIGNQPEDILKELDQGRVLIASVKPGDFTNHGHFIVIAGKEGDQIRVQDPNSWTRTKQSWSRERLFPQIKNAWSYYK